MKRTILPVTGINAATQTALDAKAPVLAGPPAGNFFFPVSPVSTSTAATLGVGTLRAIPWVCLSSTSLAQLGAEVTSAGDAGSKVRLGIYANSGSGYPGSLAVDAGQIAGDSATVQMLTASLALSPGVYWLAAVVQSVTTTQPTLRTVGAHWNASVPLPLGTSTPGANATSVGLATSSVTGALPSTFPAGASGTGGAARPIMKVA